MPNLYGLSVGFRLRLIVIVAFVLFAAVMVQAVVSFRGAMEDERKGTVQHSVESVHGTLEYFQKREAAGELSREDAQAAAKAAIKGLRHGDGEYFFITDMHPHTLMHPIKPELDGRDMSDAADPKGKRLFVEFVKVVRKDGAGFVDYLWPKPGESEPQPKISYVKGFAPWGWIIGTGVYVNDMNRVFWRQTTQTLVFAGVAVLLLILVSWRIGRGILRQLGGEPSELQRIAARIAERDLTSHVKVKEDDSRSITYAMDQMQSRLAEVIRRVRDNAHDVTDAVHQAADAGQAIHDAALHQTEVAGSTAAAIEQMAVSIAHVSDNTDEARSNSQRTAEVAQRGEDLARDASEGIAQISDTVTSAAKQIQVLRDRSGEIGEIADVIREISDQTNLLALNAAIEAARAGEQGRGFAVVADEVRKLAERTGAATAQISQVIVSVKAETESAVASIEEIVPKVDSGARRSKEAADALRQIREGAHDTLGRLEDVVLSMKELTAASNSVATNMQEVAQMAERSSSEIRSSTESTEKLKHSAEALEALTAGFRVD
ncbi:methyl-accepting chemotaxis protein [Aromatoleum petrolei]|uniref:Methyl-accepting chemotaxis protein n=1 Tax=Aromatoleum petrolei TaxID=76116 RepID=A0ABX1N0M0_9RHOO|nr:methyl-accepting chemotaxis protein [Aromatoleum petrolei]NMF91062.1 methyl-accepting chemotaxis protein [Aromatoleum petrolei]QTQ38131.1 Putative methyl-accepting chemotaxis protein [Aromatoleum petrolei]